MVRGGECVAFEADVCREKALAAMVDAAQRRWGRLDILHYNVGVSIAGGDAPIDRLPRIAFDRIAAINLRGADDGLQACLAGYACPAQWGDHHHLVRGRVGAISERRLQGDQGGHDRPDAADRDPECRSSAFAPMSFCPGLMDTPMAVDTRAPVRAEKAGPEVAAARDARVPLRHKMGTAWDVAKRRCSLPRMRRISSPGWRFRSMGARSSNVGPYGSARQHARKYTTIRAHSPVITKASENPRSAWE